MREKPSETNDREFECLICTCLDDESVIMTRLQEALPSFHWGEGDSTWDKVRVWGHSPAATVKVYRYESPGPFKLTIRLAPEAADVDEEYRSIRDKVLVALEAKVWKPLEPQPVSLVKPNDRFPAAYEFECDLRFDQIVTLLTDSRLWHWEAQRISSVTYIEGRIPFRIASKFEWNCKERLRLTGDPPGYKMEVGRWQDAPDRVPTCDQVHETVQTTILPALGARNVRAAGCSGA
jgi:hypothetical protein